MKGYLKKQKTLLSLLFMAGFLAVLIPAGAQTGGNPSGGSLDSAWIIPIQGDIEPSLVSFVRREAREALNQGAGFIIFEIDTFGGRVDSALQITSFIMSIEDARTVAWVRNSAASMGVSWSAGALIALSCQEIYMARGTSMGAAAPVTVGADGSAAAAEEKTVAAVRSQMAALAERNGYPVGIALAMVDLDVELWEAALDGQTRAFTLEEMERLEKEGRAPERIAVISPKGKLLSLTAGEAARFGLARGIAGSREELLGALGAGEVAGESAPSIADMLITLLTSAPVQAILIILGLVMVFLEINTPGFGIPGTVAVAAFLAVFGSSALLGRVDSLELILFLAGLGLLAVEIFVLPGFGIAGISGLILIGISLILSMQDFVIPRFDWEWSLLGRNAVVVVIGIIAAITGIAVIALLGPKIRLFDALTLKTRITGTAGGPDPEAATPSSPAGITRGISAGTAAVQNGLLGEEEEDYAGLFGKTGIAASTLRPSGRAEIEGRLYTVEGDGSFIEQGKAIKVIRVRGNRIVVRPV